MWNREIGSGSTSSTVPILKARNPGIVLESSSHRWQNEMFPENGNGLYLEELERRGTLWATST